VDEAAQCKVWGDVASAKTAEPIELPFGMVSGVSGREPKESCIRRVCMFAPPGKYD